MNCKTCGKPAVVGELYVGGRCAVCLAAENERLLKALRAIVEWEASEGSGTTEPTVEQAEWYMRIMAMAVEALALAEKDTP